MHGLPLHQSVRQRLDELQSLLAARVAEAAEASVRLKQGHAHEKEQLLNSYRCEYSRAQQAYASLSQ